jgi:transcription-repair coupling factor (superfamily II helicase)
LRGGAGDLLGGEQSGFISEIGFDTYQKIILNEAIEIGKRKVQGPVSHRE